MKRFQRIIIGVLGALLLIVAVQAFVPRTYVPDVQEPVVQVECIGDPISVDFAYGGDFMEPWTCEVQCDDNKPRYILYSNGKATQCETPPGCNDLGEDRGIECILPNASTSVDAQGS